MKSPDAVILFNAGICFFLFFLSHLRFLRFVSDTKLLKAIILVFSVGAGINICLSFTPLLGTIHSLDALSRFGCAGVSFFIYGLLCFLYVLGIVGPYETSVRIRVIRELYAYYPQAVTWEEMLTAYNAKVIISRRLEKLIGAGDLKREGATLRLTNRKSFFLFFDWVTDLLRKAVGSNLDSLEDVKKQEG